MTKLPKGLRYTIEKVQPGCFDPKTASGPILTITGRGAMLQYRLVAFPLQEVALIEETSREGKLSRDEIDITIDAWIAHNIEELLTRAGIRHLIYFCRGSSCYYDFFSKTLYGAHGLYEKKGSVARSLKNVAEINGEPIPLPPSCTYFIDKFTGAPKKRFEIKTLIDQKFEEEKDEPTDADEERERKNISQDFYKFLRYDTSIKATFHCGQGCYVYTGEPQIWLIEEKNESFNLTFENIIKVVSIRDVIATQNNSLNCFRVSLISEASSEELLAFLGLGTDLLDSEAFNLSRLVKENYCDSPEELKRFFDMFYITPEAVWNRLKDNIKKNHSNSLAASSFYAETTELPKQMSDLNAYSVSDERLKNALRPICPAITEAINGADLEKSFFKDCDIDVVAERAIDYIVALVLICLCTCLTPTSNEEFALSKKHYQEKLQTLIQRKFNNSPLGGGKDSYKEILEELQRMLVALGEDLAEDGLMEYASRTAEIRNLANLSYNDENGLIPPSLGRSL